MKSIPLKILPVLFLLMSLVSLRCVSSFPNIGLKKDYNFAGKKSITEYVIPSGNSTLDDTFGKVLFLDLQERGYHVINANRLMKTHSDKLAEQRHLEVGDSLQKRKYLPSTDIYAIARATWDSVLIVTDYSEIGYYINKYSTYAKRLSTQVAFYDRSLKDPILSFTAVDTANLYTVYKYRKLIHSEYPWMVAAKQLSENLKNIPISKVYNPIPATNQFRVRLWVDKSYRDKFPKTWKKRLLLRFVIVNDILRSQCSIELYVIEFKEWDSKFSTNLKSTLRRLYASTTSNPKSFTIGITLDPKLKYSWGTRSELGLSLNLGNIAVISAQPSFPSIAVNWNSIEEAITLVHEVGHLFGAIHVPDKNSVMYPYSGSLSYEFDELNKNIIESTKDKFFNVDEKNRIQNYFQVLENIRKSSDENTTQIVEAAGNVFMNFLSKKDITHPDQKKLNSLTFSISPDSAFAYALEGYFEFKIEDFPRAKLYFTRALDLESDFGEVKHYLSLLPKSTKVYQPKNDIRESSNNNKAINRASSAAHKKNANK